jgi:hypothetical protein
MVIHPFSGGDGWYSTAPLVLDRAGNIYGTAAFGGSVGSCSCGVVFGLTPGAANTAWAGVALYSFQNMADGAGPVSGLVMDPSGNVYGVTGGGATGNGVVFEVTP